MEPILRHRIVLEEPLSLEELQEQVAAGARFVVFPYVISLLFAVLLRYFSPAFLVKKGASLKKYSSRYNRISYLMGWWSLPSGPALTLHSIRLNRKGGIDVTADIMKNITAEALIAGTVAIKQMVTLFKEPDAADRKAFQQALKGKAAQALQIDRLVAGLFINVPEDQEPYYVLGIATSHGFARQCELLRKALYTAFYANVYFEFIDIGNDGSELSLRLKEQGLVLISNRPADQYQS